MCVCVSYSITLFWLLEVPFLCLCYYLVLDFFFTRVFILTHVFLLVEISLFRSLVFLLSVKGDLPFKTFVYFIPVVKFADFNVYDINNSFQLFCFSGWLHWFLLALFCDYSWFSCCFNVGFITSSSLFVFILLYF